MAQTLAKVVSVSFKPDMFSRINAYCAERGCSRSWFMNKAAEAFLAECLEDKEDYETAASALKAFENGDGKTYTTAELRKEFGL